MCACVEQTIPAAALKPLRGEIDQEVARLSQSGLLSGQERALLGHIVDRTTVGDTSRLYQKALAADLGFPNHKQVGVVATRVRAKLADYYKKAAGGGVRIALSDRGYEAWISYRSPEFVLSERAEIALANARAAMDQRTLPGAAAALKHIDAALSLEPGHPLVLALKAHCHATRALYGTYPRSDLEAARAIVAETSAVDRRPWESWFAEGCVKMALVWDWPGARAAFERARLLSGGAAQHLPWYTAFLACQGRAEEALPLLRAAVSQAHDSPIVRADLASIQILARRYDEAQDTIDTARALFGTRTHYLLHVHQAILYEARGDAAAAVETIARIPLRWPKTTITLGLRALFSGLTGDRQTARRHFRKLRAARALAGHYIPAGQLCIAALGAGDVDTAMTWLREGALVERDPNLVLSNVYPFFRHWHGNPAFKSLVFDTMGLPAVAPSPSS